jgi:hypothetical protein
VVRGHTPGDAQRENHNGREPVPSTHDTPPVAKSLRIVTDGREDADGLECLGREHIRRAVEHLSAAAVEFGTNTSILCSPPRRRARHARGARGVVQGRAREQCGD